MLFFFFLQNWDWDIRCFCLAVITCTVGKLQYHVRVSGWFMLCSADEFYRHIVPRLTNSSVCHPSFELHVQVPCSGRVCWQMVPEAYSSMKYISSFNICSRGLRLMCPSGLQSSWGLVAHTAHRSLYSIPNTNKSGLILPDTELILLYKKKKLA